MRLEAYNHDNHWYLMAILLESQSMHPSHIDNLPTYGIIALDEHGAPIAAGFLRCVEGSYALFDSYVTNKNMPHKDRNEALDRITKKLISWSKRNNLTKLVAFSLDENTVLRSKSHGFKPVNYKYTELNLCHS